MDNRPRQRYISLQAMITIGMIILGIAVNTVAAGIFYFNFRNQVLEDLKLRLRNIADISSIQLDPEALATVVDKTDVDNEYYIKYQKELSDIINANNDVINIYTMRQNAEGTIYFYLDAGDPNYVPDPPGVIPYDQPSDLLLATFDSPSGTVVENNVYTDEFGSVISAYVPLYKRDGSLESILAVDMNADTVIQLEQNALRQVLIYFGISIPLIALLAWFLGYQFSRQTVALTAVATRIAHISESNLETIPTALAGNSKEALNLIQIFNNMSGELQNFIQNLEQRVAERTTDLEISRQQSAKRANELQSIGEISKIITSEQKLENLLPLITRLVSESFNFYHTGIFLIDNTNQYAVLQAANSAGGQNMLKRGHKLEVGGSGIVGNVAQSGTPRISLDVGQDAVYFNNPDLPNTRSEMALPLKVRDRIVGVLDVQSERPGAFTENDASTLSILADQIAIALENAQLLAQTQQALSESQALYRQNLREGWRAFSREKDFIGYQQSLTSGKKLTQVVETDEIRQAMNRGEVLVFHADGVTQEASIVVPIKLRGQVIGTINIKAPAKNRQWSADEMNLAETISERLSIALENARLIQASQHQAIKEQQISEVTGKIGASMNLKSVLQTAVEELGRAIPGSDVFIKLQNGQEK